MRIFLALGIALIIANVANAQYGYGGYGGYGGGFPGGSYGGIGPGYGGFQGGGIGNPGLYGGGLSPYLNLRNTNLNNRATNYFNFVRPFTGGTYGNTMMSAPSTMYAGRPPFFTNLSTIYGADLDPIATQEALGKPDERGLTPVAMPPAGHPSGFMNTQAYFGQMGGMRGPSQGRGAGAPNFGLGRPVGMPRR